MSPTKTPRTQSELGDWLRRLRTKSGLTQAEAGNAVGVEARSIRRWENSGDVPGGITLIRLLEAYGVKIPGAPHTAPRAINAELAEIRTELQQLRQDAQGGQLLGVIEQLITLIAEQQTPGPALRELIHSVAVRARETGALLLEQADLLDDRLSVEASG
jgi:transcriptional regulator with XRE-family HTH domain